MLNRHKSCVGKAGFQHEGQRGDFLTCQTFSLSQFGLLVGQPGFFPNPDLLLFGLPLQGHRGIRCRCALFKNEIKHGRYSEVDEDPA